MFVFSFVTKWEIEGDQQGVVRLEGCRRQQPKEMGVAEPCLEVALHQAELFVSLEICCQVIYFIWIFP